MKPRALLLALLLGVAATGAATPPSTSDTEAASVERQGLLMLRAPPAHYRPDASYGDGYQAAPQRAARRRIARALAAGVGLHVHDDWPMPALGVDCFVLEAPDRASALRAAQRLAADPRVESAQPVQLFRVLADERAPTDPLAAAQPATTAWHLPELHALATGRGVRVAVVDSGIAASHPDLRGQVVLARDFVDGRGTAEGHGTAVAGIIAARAGNGVGIAGVAPDARLLALRACWQAGNGAQCSSFTLAKALQAAIDGRAQVLNLSLSGPDDRLLARLLDVALSRGTSVVGALDPRAAGGGFPASHPGVLAVAGDRGASPVAAVWAPAVGIPAPRPDGGWTLVSGPSYATAQVSGLVALLRERDPALGGADLRRTLLGGVPLAAERPRAIDACAAMRRASGGRCACGCATAAARGVMPPQ